jgi:hypothetical protein
MIIFTDIGVRDQKSLETTGLVQLYLKWDPGKDPGTHWIGGLVGFRAGLDTETTGTISTGDRTPAIQFVVRHYTDWATPARGCTSREKYFFLLIVQSRSLALLVTLLSSYGSKDQNQTQWLDCAMWTQLITFDTFIQRM